MKTLLAIFGVLKFVLIILLVLIIVIGVSYYMVRTRDEAVADKDEAEKDTSKYVDERYKIMRQMIDAFGDGNPNADKLEKLLALAPRISSHDDEISWDTKYIQFMKRFVDYAGKNCRPEMVGSFRLANDSLESNESNLDAARVRLFEASNRVDSFDMAPRRQLTAFGDSIMSLVKNTNDRHEKRLAKQSEREARKNDDADLSAKEAADAIAAKEKADRIRKSRTGFSSNPFANNHNDAE